MRGVGAGWIALVALVVVLLPAVAHSEGEPRFLRIGTGGERGVYFAVGTALAAVFNRSNEATAPACPKDASASCPALLTAVVQSSNGSETNLRDLAAGRIEVAIAQADVADWAFRGVERFAGTPLDRLALVGNLHDEYLHVIARAGSGIKDLPGLRGRVVSLDEPGSGTLIAARRLLDAAGLSEGDIAARYVKPSDAAHRLKQGEIEAFVVVGGLRYPAAAALLDNGNGMLLPILGGIRDRFLDGAPQFRVGQIPGGTYATVPAPVDTIVVQAQLLVDKGLADSIVVGLVDTLMAAETTAAVAAAGKPPRMLASDRILATRTIPLHPAASTAYRARGMLP